MQLLRLTVVALALCVAGPAGCKKRSDAHEAEATTHFYLRVWVERIQTADDIGLPIERRKTLGEALALLTRHRVVEMPMEHELMQRDGWNHPYRWSVKAEARGTVIKITSDGPDGVSQEGGGDDLYIEVLVPKHGPVRVLSEQ